ncbi:MAG TPA: OsmC family protein [Steroidobacteraceae bacterium]|nr:OsmC family protein [Steroidobacteraceae bacterium]
MSNPPSGSSAHVPVDVQWVGGLNFEAGRPDGPKIRVDGDAQSAPSPFDALLAAIASCASVDVVTILQKQRTPVHALNVRVEANRVESTPRRLASAVLHFVINAPGTTIEKATRAVELSVTKYCSVRSSLIADAPVSWTVELKGQP